MVEDKVASLLASMSRLLSGDFDAKIAVLQKKLLRGRGSLRSC